MEHLEVGRAARRVDGDVDWNGEGEMRAVTHVTNLGGEKVMKLRNGNRFEINIDPTEEITVEITQSTGIQDLVNYSQNAGSKPGPLSVGTPCKITPGKTGNLAVTAHFIGAGGNFTTRVTGSKGGDTSTFPYNQAPGEPFKTLVYTFFV